ncbi:MAG: M55 family metallopeptidase [Candidatus Bathyarchaeia archaeon]
MRVYIMTDMEGATCIVRPEQAGWDGYTGLEYQEARRMLTSDVNAAVEGAIQGGADEVYVDDLHGGGGAWNIVPDLMHPKAVYIRTDHESRLRLSLLDRGFDCVFLVAYHAMAGNPKAVLSHTFSSRSIYRVSVNGVEVGEISVDSAIAGSLGVPVVLVTGCSEAVAEARRFLGGVEAVVVKYGLARTSAYCLPSGRTSELIREAARRAVENLARDRGAYSVFRFSEPVRVLVEYMHPNYADRMKGVYGVERVGSREILCKADRFIDAARMLGWAGSTL